MSANPDNIHNPAEACWKDGKHGRWLVYEKDGKPLKCPICKEFASAHTSFRAWEEVFYMPAVFGDGVYVEAFDHIETFYAFHCGAVFRFMFYLSGNPMMQPHFTVPCPLATQEHIDWLARQGMLYKEAIKDWKPE